MSVELQYKLLEWSLFGTLVQLVHEDHDRLLCRVPGSSRREEGVIKVCCPVLVPDGEDTFHSLHGAELENLTAEANAPTLSPTPTPSRLPEEGPDIATSVMIEKSENTTTTINEVLVEASDSEYFSEDDHHETMDSGGEPVSDVDMQDWTDTQKRDHLSKLQKKKGLAKKLGLEGKRKERAGAKSLSLRSASRVVNPRK
ncbi:hypothetical protein BGZ94_003671 [Podila epigama]|nr:hypothetical protein BGZ94_003670 [Podila epigama]KAF9405256.1 hypothetical protein BGZ94_003671 [Podila epigama]